MSQQKRVNSGVPTGGQFAEHARDDSTVTLIASPRSLPPGRREPADFFAPAVEVPDFDGRRAARFSEDADELRVLAASQREDVLHLVARNRHSPADLLEEIAFSSTSAVTRIAVARNDTASREVIDLLARDTSREVRFFARQHPTYSPRGVVDVVGARVARFVLGV
jgi:hypothetical protein